VTRPPPRILVVEDDDALARLLELELGHRGMTVRLVADGPRAESAVEAFRPDLVILDVLLPGMDGEQVLARLRSSGCDVPVVMLTALDRPRLKVGALEAGADDYVTKPFDIDELVARMRAVLRRRPAKDHLRVGDLEVSVAERTATRAGNPLDLSPKEFDLLAVLVADAPRVVSRERILATVWGEDVEVDPNVVDVYVGYLRRKLERLGPRLIQTVRGVGFVVRADPR
jgi:DNA-binding response OmpR family regulator